MCEQRGKAGELTIRPQQSEDDFYRWMANIQDWCISRQLWWGHRCPVYYVKMEGGEGNWNDGEYWVAGRDLEEAKQKATKKFPGATFTLEQDEDVLDTWFSSGLWPFSIMGWPDKVRPLRRRSVKPDECADARSGTLLSCQRPGDRLGHPSILGRPDGHAGR
jgi:valyl-tRNA synthetase